jgi:hypothetical protein
MHISQRLIGVQLAKLDDFARKSYRACRVLIGTGLLLSPHSLSVLTTCIHMAQQQAHFNTLAIVLLHCVPGLDTQDDAQLSWSVAVSPSKNALSPADSVGMPAHPAPFARL